LPTDPDEQNRSWRYLYNQVRDSASIQDAHKDYLLYRDVTWLTLPTTAVCFAWLLFFQHFRGGLIYLSVSICIYFLVRIIAAKAGTSFVKMVLSCAGDASPLPTKNIIHP
jgi:hypothetical protein